MNDAQSSESEDDGRAGSPLEVNPVLRRLAGVVGPEGVVVLGGYPGPAGPGLVRLYHDFGMTSYSEVEEGDILHSEVPADADEPVRIYLAPEVRVRTVKTTAATFSAQELSFGGMTGGSPGLAGGLGGATTNPCRCVRWVSECYPIIVCRGVPMRCSREDYCTMKCVEWTGDCTMPA